MNLPNQAGLEKRIDAFARLGTVIQRVVHYYQGKNSVSTDEPAAIVIEAVERSIEANPWFIHRHVVFALSGICQLLTREKLSAWAYRYLSHVECNERTGRIGVVNAGNIPAVGFHDMLCVVTAGYEYVGRLSADDAHLLPAFAGCLAIWDKHIGSMIRFTQDERIVADAIIATGSDNTLRYFEYFYGNKPHLFRGNRNGITILDGSETHEQLVKLGLDITMHFGLGCRNVSLLLVPMGYDFTALNKAMLDYSYLSDHPCYTESIRYQRALLTMRNMHHLFNGVNIWLPTEQLAQPIGVTGYLEYADSEDAIRFIEGNKSHIQCIVSEKKLPFPSVSFGNAQQPDIYDYADGTDTMEFLNKLW